MKTLIGKIITLLFLMNLTFINCTSAFTTTEFKNNAELNYHKTFSKNTSLGTVINLIAELEELEEDDVEDEISFEHSIAVNYFLIFSFSNFEVFHNVVNSNLYCFNIEVKSNLLPVYKTQHSFLI